MPDIDKQQEQQKVAYDNSLFSLNGFLFMSVLHLEAEIIESDKVISIFVPKEKEEIILRS